MTPAISVIVPVHNGAAFCAESIASIVAQEQRLEIIVIDDGSTDGLAEVIDHGAVRYIHQAQRGPGAARNAGLRLATSELIAFLDVDDLWTGGHLARLTAALLTQPNAGFAQGYMQQFVRRGAETKLVSGSYRMPYLGACLFRRETLTELNGFDERMRMGEDYDLILRCWEHDVPRVCVDEVSLLYRRHAGNMTRGRNDAANLEVLERRIKRIRCGAFDTAAARRFPFAGYAGDLTTFISLTEALQPEELCRL